jgi:hypothetical protein
MCHGPSDRWLLGCAACDVTASMAASQPKPMSRNAAHRIRRLGSLPRCRRANGEENTARQEQRPVGSGDIDPAEADVLREILLPRLAGKFHFLNSQPSSPSNSRKRRPLRPQSRPPKSTHVDSWTPASRSRNSDGRGAKTIPRKWRETSPNKSSRRSTNSPAAAALPLCSLLHCIHHGPGGRREVSVFICFSPSFSSCVKHQNPISSGASPWALMAAKDGSSGRLVAAFNNFLRCSGHARNCLLYYAKWSSRVLPDS